MTYEIQPEELQFAESMGQLFEAVGVTRMAGRIWGYLLITEDPEVTAMELQERLGASAGSISMATRDLIRLGLVDRKWIPGERRDYFAMRPGAVLAFLRLQLDQLAAASDLAEAGIEQFGTSEDARPRLEAFNEVYHWYMSELVELHDRFKTSH